MTEKQYRLLIIDDDDFILSTLELAFENTPYLVTTVNNPFKAYSMIEESHFDIVISDIVMPGMDGLTLLEKIKDYNGMIQVIMLTGEITVNNTIKAFRKGAVDIFFKPLETMGQIVTAVDEAAKKLDRVNAILSKASPVRGN